MESKESIEQYREQRVKQIHLSIFNPHYVSHKAKLSLICKVTNKFYNTILDYGAGNAPYRSYFKFDKYIMADVAQNYNNSIDIIINKETEKIPLDNESVDFILCMDVLEHIKYDTLALKELFRVLKNDGGLLIVVPFIYREHEYPYDYRRYTSSGIAALLNSLGFEIIEITKIGNCWLTAYMIINESHIKLYERHTITFIRKVFRKLFNTLVLPLLNVSVFSKQPLSDDATYFQLLIYAKK